MIGRWRSLLLPLIGLVAASAPAPALAFMCSPMGPPASVENCWCTFILPCPVADGEKFAQKMTELKGAQEKLKLLESMKSPQDALLKAIGGQGSPLSGLNSIGIDLSTAGKGFGVDSLAKIGLDAGTITGIQNGTIPVSKLGDIAQSVGLDRGAISIPGLDGKSISDIGDRVQDVKSTMSIPLDGIPGLGGSDPQSAALCATPGDLISVGQEDVPNDFVGALYPPEEMVPALDRFLSGGGDMELFEENLDEAKIARRSTAERALARSIVIRDLLPRALKSVEAIDLSGEPGGSVPDLSTEDWMSSRGADFMSSGVPTEDTLSLLRDFEGYIDHAKYDVNAERCGYGSDTQTLADGSIVKVTKGMQCTREDSERDLARRSQEFANTAARQTGDAWATYDSKTQAALTSIAYNYGSLPNRIVDEARSGDKVALANSIRGLSGDNDGVNAKRRYREAALIDGNAEITPNGPGTPGAAAVPGGFASSSFGEQMAGSQDFQQDQAVNDALKAQLLVAQSETASMMTTVTSLLAARMITPETMSPVMLNAHNAGYQAARQAEAAERASDSVPAEETRVLAKDQAEFVRLARRVVENHNLIGDWTLLESAKPGVVTTIDIHEGKKADLIGLEPRIVAALAVLYEDPNDAWAILRPMLARAAGDYLDSNKWQSSGAYATQMSTNLTAQNAVTAFGKRKPYVRPPVTSDAETGYPTFSTIGKVGYGYEGSFEEMGTFMGANDPYRISVVTEYDLINYPTSLSEILQVYLETQRRMNYVADFRRGGAKQAMSGTVWTEMTTNAPECITGPFAYSPAAAAARPELFDLSKECNHLVWNGGDLEDYIPSNLLGGADAALWMTKSRQDRIMLMTGGPESVRNDLATALGLAQKNRLVARAEMLGLPSSARHMQEILSTLSQVASDNRFTQQVSFPKE